MVKSQRERKKCNLITYLAIEQKISFCSNFKIDLFLYKINVERKVPENHYVKWLRCLNYRDEILWKFFWSVLGKGIFPVFDSIKTFFVFEWFPSFDIISSKTIVFFYFFLQWLNNIEIEGKKNIWNDSNWTINFYRSHNNRKMLAALRKLMLTLSISLDKTIPQIGRDVYIPLKKYIVLHTVYTHYDVGN